MKSSRAIYLEAARSIAEGEEVFCCNAIDDAARNGGGSKEQGRFEALMKPDAKEARRMQPAGWLRAKGQSHADAKHRRVIALCLMAAAA